jgi:hypothetical protein
MVPAGVLEVSTGAARPITSIDVNTSCTASDQSHPVLIEPVTGSCRSDFRANADEVSSFRGEGRSNVTR